MTTQPAETLIETRRQELLDIGYGAPAVDLAIKWARQSARGMNDYVAGEQGDSVYTSMLPQYLTDCEKYLKNLGHVATG